jgi:hypothetical protein
MREKVSIWGKLPPWGEWAVLILIALLGLWVLDLVPNPKRITEYVINAFAIGAVLGSVITYFYATREKRAISRVRDDISFLSAWLELNSVQSRRTMSAEATKEIVNDERVLKTYHWACDAKSVYKLNPDRLAASIIIFEELLGLDRMDAVRAMKNVKDLDDLKAYLQKIKHEKLSPP